MQITIDGKEFDVPPEILQYINDCFAYLEDGQPGGPLSRDFGFSFGKPVRQPPEEVATRMERVEQLAEEVLQMAVTLTKLRGGKR